ncbi:cytochrome c [Pseudoroseomonas cervicalis]|uniref:c-type cytochrome n=1 Tax=Teichococcus cervicalis TaxID=204525 RepID=UPI0022F1C6D6|nr:c-type cytochrome [Pseudoroseomonas cervicalis]WBV45253.1 c-type cytochrome [Pseudoroseomonas cervicalis]
MSRLTSAAPVIGALLLAAVGGGVLAYFVGNDPAPTEAARPSPQPEPLPGWARQALVASPQDGEQIFVEGVSNVAACATCHGAQGMPERGAPYPRLAGLSADYVAKQLDDYANDVRRNEQMRPIARALNGPQRGAVAQYVASLPLPQTQLSVAGLDQRGRELDEVGDNARAIPGCGNCHGPRGRGEGVMLPPLAGQPEAYLVSQLNAFRQQRRHNDTVEVMEGIASRLSDEDIRSLARYFSQLAPVRQEARSQP